MEKLNRVVVVGGSVAGLAAAAQVAPRAREVVVVERRDPQPTGSVAPQGHLPHVLLSGGAFALERLFPGFARRLLALGAVSGGDDPDVVACLWAAAGARRDHIPLPSRGVPRALCSRPMLEGTLRAATAAVPGVGFVDDAVVDVLTRGGSVTGVRLRSGGVLVTDLVVDAAGRSSRCDQWLAAHGWPEPAVSEVGVDLRYTTFLVERRPEDFDGGAFAVVQNTEAVPRVGVVLPTEGGRWHIALGGYFGVAAPADPAGARRFAASLADPRIADLLARPFLQEPSRYTFRSSRRRHREKLHVQPRGYCSIGDSVASFNPIYGQGMTSAVLQAEALGAMLDRHGSGVRFAAAMARATAKVVDNPWLTATGADFIYPETSGQRPPGTAFVNRYVERVMRAAAVDEHVNAAFTSVQQMLAVPSSLFHPAVVARVARHGGLRSQSAAPVVAAAA